MVDILVGGARHDELGARDAQIHAHAVVSAMLLVMRGPFDGHAAMRDAIEEGCELGCSFADVFIDCWGYIDTAERNLNGDRHCQPPTGARNAEGVPRSFRAGRSRASQ